MPTIKYDLITKWALIKSQTIYYLFLNRKFLKAAFLLQLMHVLYFNFELYFIMITTCNLSAICDLCKSYFNIFSYLK